MLKSNYLKINKNSLFNQVSRLDVTEDAGHSVNPLVDIGQVEGALVMGLGLYTQEKPIYDVKTGRRITDTTWVN